MSKDRMRRPSVSLPIPGSNHLRARNDALSSILAGGFPYSNKLSAHTSCVNALAFSNRDARFLASGGDDLVVNLWDFHQDDLKKPSVSLNGPRGNIFCLAFSASNRYIYSGGTDEIILQYDIAHLGSDLNAIPSSPSSMFRDHEDTIRGISCHAFRDEIFLSASQDGCIITHDTRTADGRSKRAQNTIQLTTEATDVQFHPNLEHIFLTSDSRGSVCLRDTRMSFGPLTARAHQGVVQTYNTRLSTQGHPHLSNPEVSSVAFDREGSKIAVSMLHYFPVIYGLSDPNPLAICTGGNHPDGTRVPPTERSYSNSCTIKHGSFGSAGFGSDELYATGSEDFRGYVWKIPSLQFLEERRVEHDIDDWLNRDLGNTVGFTEGPNDPRYVPMELSTPLFRLTGHKSIVNSTLIHPDLPYIVTAGIERDIILHSPKPSSPCFNDMQRTSTEVRTLGDDGAADRAAYIRALTEFDMVTGGGREDPENMTIMMFDHIVREEGTVDVFAVRKWSGDSDSSDGFGADSDSDMNADDLF